MRVMHTSTSYFYIAFVQIGDFALGLKNPIFRSEIICGRGKFETKGAAEDLPINSPQVSQYSA